MNVRNISLNVAQGDGPGFTLTTRVGPGDESMSVFIGLPEPLVIPLPWRALDRSAWPDVMKGHIPSMAHMFMVEVASIDIDASKITEVSPCKAVGADGFVYEGPVGEILGGHQVQHFVCNSPDYDPGEESFQ